MKNFFSLFVIAAIIVGGGWYLYDQKKTQDDQAAIEKRLRDARRSFAERARGAVTEEETDDYLRQIRAALSAYEQELKNTVYADRPDWFDVEAKKNEMQALFEKGEISEAQHRGMMKRYALVREAYDTLMAGTWEPDLTKIGAGETRLDIFDVKRIRDPDGNPVLEARFFLWGVEPNTRLSWGNLALEYWVAEEPDRKVKRRRRREGIRDPEALNAPVYKPLGRAEGTASPIVVDQEPSETIAEFPSYVTIGTLWFPQVPKEAKLMDLRYEYAARKGGSLYESRLAWEKMEIPSNWRLAEGEQWMAETVEASEEEMEGFDPTVDAGTAAE